MLKLTADMIVEPCLYDERAALEKLPEMPGTDQKENNQAVALKTGTDNLPINNAVGDYKKLTKKSDFDSNQMSSVGFSEGKDKIALEQNSKNANLLQIRHLGAKKEPMSSSDTGSISNGLGWIRTSEGLRQRVYSPSPLATRAPTQFELEIVQKTKPFATPKITL